MPRQPIQPPEGAEPNARTVSSYELVAADYARETAGGGRSEPLVRLAAVVPGSEVLEVGSGPGWDADALEVAGLRVRRTDVTQAFIDLQQARGKRVDRLDVVVDDLGGPYDGIVALAVLQHVPRQRLPGVLARMAAALAPAGALLVCVRTGAGESWEIGESGNPYYCALWGEGEFVDMLEAVGLRVAWQDASIDSEDNDWLYIVASRVPGPTD
jgi:SAM-dependent methyltransferase